MKRNILIIFAVFATIFLSNAQTASWGSVVEDQLVKMRASDKALQEGLRAKGYAVDVSTSFNKNTSTFTTEIFYRNAKQYENSVNSAFLQRSKELYVNAFLQEILQKDPSGYVGLDGLTIYEKHNAKLKFVYSTIKNGKKIQKNFVVTYAELQRALLTVLGY